MPNTNTIKRFISIFLWCLSLPLTHAQVTATSQYRTPNHELWTTLLQKHVSNAGEVNYKAFLDDRQLLKNYINELAQHFPQDNWTRNEVMAYWINAYNALTIDLILEHYPLQSIKDIFRPWHKSMWQLGSQRFDLDTIEHDILRPMGDPRIHFAIVCAAKSCPRLLNQAYTTQELQEQLKRASYRFINNAKKNDIRQSEVKISKIFRWFRKDFEVDGSLIDFLNRYSEIKISDNAKIKYLNYDWSLNN